MRAHAHTHARMSCYRGPALAHPPIAWFSLGGLYTSAFDHFSLVIQRTLKRVDYSRTVRQHEVSLTFHSQLHPHGLLVVQIMGTLVCKLDLEHENLEYMLAKLFTSTATPQPAQTTLSPTHHLHLLRCHRHHYSSRVARGLPCTR